MSQPRDLSSLSDEELDLQVAHIVQAQADGCFLANCAYDHDEDVDILLTVAERLRQRLQTINIKVNDLVTSDRPHDALIYLVTGSTGTVAEEDYTWNVRAYFDEAQAQAHADRAQKRADEIVDSINDINIPLAEKLEPWKINNEEDPNMEIDGGVSYSVKSIFLSIDSLQTSLTTPKTSLVEAISQSVPEINLS
jgi:hypothetical protein